MAIVASCKCGKKFKVKDELAGKAVKCPSCGSPLRIPSGGGKSSTGGESSAPKVDAEKALLRFEEAQRKKQISAEEEAAAREEQNKLIASYDQLTGKAAKPEEKKKKTELLAGPPKKPTIFTKIADLFGTLFGTFAFKYVAIAVVSGAAIFGSVMLVKYITGYVGDQSGPQMGRGERVKQLMETAEKAIGNQKWQEAATALNEVVQLEPKKEMNRDYQEMRKTVQEHGG